MSMSNKYDASIVSQSFIKQYYDMFARNPGELHKFYKEDSAFAHGDGVQITDVVSGVESIRERVNELNLAGARVDLSEGSVDAQQSENDGVFLTVTGHVTLLAKPTRPFVQSFFLACQNSGNQKMVSYFVRNSVFRLLGNPLVESETVTTQIPVAQPVEDVIAVDNLEASVYLDADVEAEAGAKDVEEDVYEQDGVEDEDVDLLHGADADAIVEAGLEADQLDDPAHLKDDVDEDDIVYDDQNDLEPQETADSSPIATPTPNLQPPSPSPPKSFADVVKRLAGDKPAPPAAQGQSSNGRSSSNKKVKSHSDEARDRDNDAQTTTTASTNNAPPKHPVCALYVNQLVADTTQEDITEVFSQFGEVKSVDIHRGYAFIEFMDAVAARAVLAQVEVEPIHIKGQAVKVEERQTRAKDKHRERDKGSERQGHGHRDKDNKERGPGSRGGGGGAGGDKEKGEEGRRHGEGSRERVRKEGGRGRGGGGGGGGRNNADAGAGGGGGGRERGRERDREHDRDGAAPTQGGGRQSQKANANAKK